MKPEDSESLVLHRLRKSEEALQAARIMLEKEMLSFAMNRIYYALYYVWLAGFGWAGVGPRQVVDSESNSAEVRA